MIQIQATKIFYRNLNSTAKVVVNRGGARSSKSISILQTLIYKFLTEEKKKFLIVRRTFPSLRLTTWYDFKQLISKLGIESLIKEERKFFNYYYKDNFMHFGSLDDIEKIKSSNWNYIFMEEATEFDYEDYVILKLRLSAPSVDGKRNQMFLAFNPTDENHWIKTKVLDKESDVEEIHSTYKDNPFLSADYKQMLEDLANQDPNFYRIYVLGEWGRYEHLIFTNFKVVPSLDEEDFSENVFYGLDFGYSAPTALVKIIESKTLPNTIYVTEELYRVNQTNKELIETLERIIPKKTIPIYADSAEPDRIKEIKHAGFNIKPSKKGILDSIDAVKRFKMIIPEKSVNLIKELRVYSWQTDKDGNPIEKPVNCPDHAISALRYALHTHKGSRKLKIRML